MSLGVAQLSSLRLGASSTCPVALRLGVRKIHVRKQVGQSSRHSLAVDAAGTAVQGVVDEEVTFHTEYSPTHRAGEHLHNHTHTQRTENYLHMVRRPGSVSMQIQQVAHEGLLLTLWSFS